MPNINIENESKDPKQENKITIVKQDPVTDLTDLLVSLKEQLGIDDSEFYKKFEKLITYDGKIVEADVFRAKFLDLIKEYTNLDKHREGTPLETDSTKNTEVHEFGREDEESNILDVPTDPVRESSIKNDFEGKAKSKIEEILEKYREEAAKRSVKPKHQQEVPRDSSSAEESLTIHDKTGEDAENLIVPMNEISTPEEGYISSATVRESGVDNEFEDEHGAKKTLDKKLLDYQDDATSAGIDGIKYPVTVPKEPDPGSTDNLMVSNKDHITLARIPADLNVPDDDIIPASLEKQLKSVSGSTTKEGQTSHHTVHDSGDAVGGVADLDIGSTSVSTEMSVEDIARKMLLRVGSAGIDVFLYNLIPYAAGSTIYGVAKDIEGSIKKASSGDALGAISSIAEGAGSLLGTAAEAASKAKYFTLGEIAKLLGMSNFFSLPGWRGISIKDMSFAPGTPFSVETVEARNYFDEDGNTIRFGNLDKRGKQPSDELFETITDQSKEMSFNVPDERNRENGRWLPMNLRDANFDMLTDIDRLKENFTTVIDLRETETTDYIVYKESEDRNSLSKQGVEDRLRRNTNVWQVGSIYVWPIDQEEGISPVWIPFEFNPTIEESTRSARYEATQILARMGNLHSYTGTDSISVTITTRYTPLARKWEDLTNAEQERFKDSWMSVFDMVSIQNIEMALRSLTMPSFSSASGIDSGYKYSKPPLLKIVMGDKNRVQAGEMMSHNTPFSNLLCYPQELIQGDVLQSESFTGQKRFRTFVATGVQITKDLNTTPLLIEDRIERAGDNNETPYIKDTMGFDVTITMIEVTPNYMDVMPNFSHYYGAASERYKTLSRG
tara:strand:- start:86 stop:2605 length:2520 start_codon:yes stop_codon:yes gene_type:complete